VWYDFGMTTIYSSFLKDLREQRGLSQAEVATMIKMSRPSYVAVEKGTKELSLSEAVAIVHFFGITLDELLRVQTSNLSKYKQMLLAFLREAKNDEQVLKKTKLAKLLYLADFSWYYLHHESMSGMMYRKVDFGPVSDAYFRLLDEMEQQGELNIIQVIRDDYHMYEIEETRASQKIKLDLLTKDELKHIGKIWKKWADANTAEIVAFTHKQLPYVFAKDNEVVSYEVFTQENQSEIY